MHFKLIYDVVGDLERELDESLAAGREDKAVPRCYLQADPFIRLIPKRDHPQSSSYRNTKVI